MKKIIFVILLLISMQAISQGQRFQVKGYFNNVPPAVEMVSLTYYLEGKEIKDSVNFKKGKYSFKGTIQEPLTAFIRLMFPPDADGKRPRILLKNVIPLFLTPDRIRINSVDSFRNATVKGSKGNDDYKKLQAFIEPYNNKVQTAGGENYKASVAKDEEWLKRTGLKMDTAEEERRQAYGLFAKNNPQSPVAIYALSHFAVGNFIADDVEQILQSFPEKSRQTPTAIVISGNITKERKTGIGVIAMDFTQNDPDDKPVSLHDFRGKYVLLDFWASWCVPCRKENPAVVAAFKQFKNKGFDILSVSLDRPGAKDKWLKAIKDDGLTWTHTSDLKGFDNDVVVQYGIKAVPRNFLIDPAGKIIAKDLRGAQLQKKLEQILK